MSADAGAVLTIAGSRLTVRLTRDMWFLEPHHVDLARAVSAVARSAGATPEPEAIQEVQLAIAAKPDEVDLGFWRAVLGYAPMSPDNGLDPLGHGSTVWMQELDAAKPLRHAMHVDVSLAKEQAHERARRRVGSRRPRSWPSRRSTGRSRTGPATGSASPSGPTAARRGSRPTSPTSAYLPLAWCSSL